MCINKVSISLCFQCNTQELCCQLSVHSGYSFQRPRCLQGMPQVVLVFWNLFLKKNIDSYNSLMACFEVILFWTDWCFVTAVADQEDDEVCGGHSPQPDRCPFDLVDWQVLEHPPSVCGPPLWYHSLSPRGDVTGRQLRGLLHTMITVFSGCR